MQQAKIKRTISPKIYLTYAIGDIVFDQSIESTYLEDYLGSKVSKITFQRKFSFKNFYKNSKEEEERPSGRVITLIIIRTHFF